MMSINVGMQPFGEVLASYLPPSHVAAQLSDIYIALNCGATVYFAQPDALKVRTD